MAASRERQTTRKTSRLVAMGGVERRREPAEAISSILSDIVWTAAAASFTASIVMASLPGRLRRRIIEAPGPTLAQALGAGLVIGFIASRSAPRAGIEIEVDLGE